MMHIDEALPFIGASKSEALSPPVFDLLKKYDLLGYRGPRVPLPGCTLAETPSEFIAEWEGIFDHFRNRLIRPLTTCASDNLGPKVKERLRTVVAMANREMKRRYPLVPR